MCQSWEKLTQFNKAYRIRIEFDLSGSFQSRCQQCMIVGNKTSANRIIVLPNSVVMDSETDIKTAVFSPSQSIRET